MALTCIFDKIICLHCSDICVFQTLLMIIMYTKKNLVCKSYIIWKKNQSTWWKKEYLNSHQIRPYWYEARYPSSSCFMSLKGNLKEKQIFRFCWWSKIMIYEVGAEIDYSIFACLLSCWFFLDRIPCDTVNRKSEPAFMTVLYQFYDPPNISFFHF